MRFSLAHAQQMEAKATSICFLASFPGTLKKPNTGLRPWAPHWQRAGPEAHELLPGFLLSLGGGGSNQSQKIRENIYVHIYIYICIQYIYIYILRLLKSLGKKNKGNNIFHCSDGVPPKGRKNCLSKWKRERERDIDLYTVYIYICINTQPPTAFSTSKSALR